MIRASHRGLLPLVGLFVLGLVQPVQAQALPKGGDILDKYIEVTGGKAAYEKLKNRVMKGTMDIAAAGIKGDLTIYTAAPDKFYMQVELPGVGKIEEGCDGKVAWAISPTGPRVKDGAEKESALRRADFNGEVHWQKHYKKVECVGEETVERKPCYKVQLTTPNDEVKTRYYDKSTGLLVKSTGTEKGQMGDIPVETIVSDYKKVDGISLPFKSVQKTLGTEFNITLEKVEHNVKLPDNRFDLPDDIKQLIKK